LRGVVPHRAAPFYRGSNQQGGASPDAASKRYRIAISLNSCAGGAIFLSPQVLTRTTQGQAQKNRTRTSTPMKRLFLAVTGEPPRLIAG